MKKIFLLVMIAVFGLQMKAADQFDEIDLRGGWELVSYSGDYGLFTTPDLAGDSDYEGTSMAISDCKYLYLEDCIYVDEYNSTTDWYIESIIPLLNFTPSNKYNEWMCVAGSFTQRGLPPSSDENIGDIITDYFISNNNKLHIQLSATTLHFVIESLTSTEMRLKSFDGKFTATYNRISDPSNVNALTVQSTSEEIYNINGIKTRTPSKGINIIRRGKKVTKKIL